MTRYRVHRDIRFRRVIDEGIVLLQEAGDVMGVNSTGIRILELVKEGLDDDAIVRTIRAELDTRPATVDGDVREFLLELVDQGVISPAGSEDVDHGV